MKLLDMTCPHCGSTLKIQPGSKKAICEFCGSEFLLDDEVRSVQFEDAEEAGYQFEKGRQRARKETRKRDRSYGGRPQDVQKRPVPPSGKGSGKKRRVPVALLAIMIGAAVIASWRNGTGKRTPNTTITKTEQPDLGLTWQETEKDVTSAGTAGDTRKSYSSAKKPFIVKAASGTKTETEDIGKEPIPQTKDAGHYNESLKGRGNSDAGRSEPSYVGVIGYLAVAYSQAWEIEKTDRFQNKDLWNIVTYKPDKQFWDQSVSLPCKTEVVVREQMLEHEGYGRYSGYLRVEKTDDGTEYYIDVENFVTKPYWTYQDDLRTAALTGIFVAEYNQKSDYYPVTNRGEKLEIPDGTIVLVTGISGTRSEINEDQTDIEAKVWKEWSRGYGGVDCCFNHDDLTIVF